MSGYSYDVEQANQEFSERVDQVIASVTTGLGLGRLSTAMSRLAGVYRLRSNEKTDGHFDSDWFLIKRSAGMLR